MSKTKTKFKVGDKVEVINYGHAIWDKENGVVDLSPELVGQQGIVVKADRIGGYDHYALHGLNKSSWYDNGQLKLVE